MSMQYQEPEIVGWLSMRGAKSPVDQAVMDEFLSTNLYQTALGSTAEERFNSRTEMDLFVSVALKIGRVADALQFATDFDIIAARVALDGSVQAVMRDLADLESHVEGIDGESVRSISQTVRLARNVLASQPEQLPEQVLCRLSRVESHGRVCSMLDRALAYKRSAWMHPVVSGAKELNRGLEGTIDLAGELIQRVAVSEQGEAWILSDNRLLRFFHQQLRVVHRHHLFDQSCVELACSNQFVAVSTRGGSVLIFDQKQSRPITSIAAHERAVLGCVFLQDGSLVTVGTDGRICVWEIPSGKNRHCIKTTHDSLHSVAWLGGARIAVGSGRGLQGSFAEIWDLASETVRDRLGPFEWEADHIAIDPQRTKVAIGANCVVSVWDVRTSERLFEFRTDNSKCHALTFIAEDTLACGDTSGELRLWSIATGEEIARPMAHSALVSAICRLNENRFVTTSWDQTIRVWDRREITKRHTTHSEQVTCVACSPDSQQFVTGSQDKNLIIWRREGKQLGSLSGHGHWISGVAFGSLIVSSSWDGTVRFWCPRTFDCLKVRTCSDKPIKLFVYDQSSGQFATADTSGLVKLWDSESTEPVATLPLELKDAVALDFAPGNRQTIRIGSSDGRLVEWHPASNNTTTVQIAIPSRVTAWELSLLEKLYVGCADGLLFEVSLEGKILGSFGHKGCGPIGLRCVDGGRLMLAVGGTPQIASDHTTRLYCLKKPIRQLAKFVADSPVTAVEAIGSQLVAIGDASGGVHVLQLMNIT